MLSKVQPHTGEEPLQDSSDYHTDNRTCATPPAPIVSPWEDKPYREVSYSAPPATATISLSTHSMSTSPSSCILPNNTEVDDKGYTTVAFRKQKRDNQLKGKPLKGEKKNGTFVPICHQL